MSCTNVKIAPSLFSADFSKMGEEVLSLERAGADMLHCDVMDGVFVPNMSFGIKMIEDIRKLTKLPLDVHLMIVDPEKYVERFAAAGADIITAHYEACRNNLAEVLKLIGKQGVKCGFAFNPDCGLNQIKEYIPLCDMVLVMSVYAGFGGQTFIKETLDSIEFVRNEIDKSKKDVLLEVDGGVDFSNSAQIKAAGANVLVSGSTIFRSHDRALAIKKLREG